MLIEIAAVLCSLAHGISLVFILSGDPLGVDALVGAGCLEALLSIMSFPDSRLVDASARALRAIVQYPILGKSNVFQVSLTLMKVAYE